MVYIDPKIQTLPLHPLDPRMNLQDKLVLLRVLAVQGDVNGATA